MIAGLAALGILVMLYVAVMFLLARRGPTGIRR